MSKEIENKPDFNKFPKMARLSRECIITEKIDGTNAQIFITEDGGFYTGSRNRWITPSDDNYGFSAWAHENKDELMKLGVGRHFGEWWGRGIQRNYGLSDRRFSLFNVSRWKDNPDLPDCCSVVPVIYLNHHHAAPYTQFSGVFNTTDTDDSIWYLQKYGSQAAPGFMDPEGIVVWHTAANIGFKKTIKNDEQPKSLAK